MRTKLIVTDLDRTLLRSDKTVSEYSARIFSACRDAGIYTAFATARPISSARRYRDKIIITPDFIIADNGADVRHSADLHRKAESQSETESYDYSEIMRILPIPTPVAAKFIRTLLSSGKIGFLSAEAGGITYTNYSGEPWEQGWMIESTDFGEIPPGVITKISVECANANFIAQTVDKYPELRVYSNTGEDWYMITHADASKLNGIAYIADSIGISLTEVAAFGDDFNDIEMLRECGIGVAVANAIEEAKSAADYICETNDNDGVARWIEQNILS